MMRGVELAHVPRVDMRGLTVRLDLVPQVAVTKVVEQHRHRVNTGAPVQPQQTLPKSGVSNRKE